MQTMHTYRKQATYIVQQTTNNSDTHTHTHTHTHCISPSVMISSTIAQFVLPCVTVLLLLLLLLLPLTAPCQSLIDCCVSPLCVCVTVLLLFLPAKSAGQGAVRPGVHPHEPDRGGLLRPGVPGPPQDDGEWGGRGRREAEGVGRPRASVVAPRPCAAAVVPAVLSGPSVPLLLRCGWISSSLS